MKITVLKRQRSAISRKFSILRGKLVTSTGEAPKKEYFKMSRGSELVEPPIDIPGDYSCYPNDFAWKVLCGLSEIDISSYFLHQSDGVYFDDSEFWGSSKCTKIVEPFAFCGYMISPDLEVISPLGSIGPWWEEVKPVL